MKSTSFISPALSLGPSHRRRRSRRRSIVISLLVCRSVGRLLSPLRRSSLGAALRAVIDGGSGRIGVVDWRRHGHVVLHVVVIGAIVVVSGLGIRIARVDAGEFRSAHKPLRWCQSVRHTTTKANSTKGLLTLWYANGGSPLRILFFAWVYPITRYKANKVNSPRKMDHFTM